MKALAVSLVLVLLLPTNQPENPNLDGIWFGPLKVGPATLRLGLHVKTKDGKLTATVDSIDQGAKGLTVDSIDFKDGKLTFKMTALAASFEGKLNDAGTAFAGKFTQAGQSFDLELKKVDKLPEIARPQEPKRPYPYLDEEVTYENKKAGITFAGTLTLPKGDGPFPAVVLVTGSGPQDRDETVANHKPFWIIADYLTRKGIAVLRVDDRGVGKTKGGNVDRSTTADFAEDALCGVAFLKGRKEINKAKIGIIGHSEGGLVAPLAATQSRDVAFIVMLAGPGLPGEDILLLQGAAILKAEGKENDKELARQRTIQQAIFKILKEEKDDEKAEKAMRAFAKEFIDKLPEDEKKAALPDAKLIEAQIQTVTSPWFRFFLTHDPRPILRKVQVPVLALLGELDMQVPAKENQSEIEKALKAGGNRDFTVRTLPKLNHLFQTAKTGGLSEYANIEETMAPVVLELMAEWILKR